MGILWQSFMEKNYTIMVLQSLRKYSPENTQGILIYIVGSNVKIKIVTQRKLFKSPKKSTKNNVQKMYMTINSIKNEEFNSQARRSKGLKRKS